MMKVYVDPIFTVLQVLDLIHKAFIYILFVFYTHKLHSFEGIGLNTRPRKGRLQQA